MSKNADVIVERDPTNFPAIATAQETIDSLLNSVGQKLDMASKLLFMVCTHRAHNYNFYGYF